MKKFLSIILTICITINMCGCSTKETISRSLFCFNTYVEITFYDWNDDTDTEAVINQCIEMCKSYEKMFSKTITTSEISQINSNSGDTVTVSETTASLINDCIEYSILTNGAFDITIAPIVDLWNITGTNPKVPSKKEIDNCLQYVGYKNINVNNNQVSLKENTKIDLGGIVKGFVADKIKEYITKSGVTSAIIDLGGNILTVGSNNDESFKIGVKKPFTESGEIIATIDVIDKSVVTSGIYERYFKDGAKIYHHIFDTQNGYPVDNDLYSVTIISDNSEDGDALSTSLLSLGLEKSIDLLNSLDKDIEAIFVTNEYEVIVTKGLSIDTDNHISLVFD